MLNILIRCVKYFMCQIMSVINKAKPSVEDFALCFIKIERFTG